MVHDSQGSAAAPARDPALPGMDLDTRPHGAGGSDRPRVAVVCGYYDSKSGYVENVLAEGLAELTDVFVVTSTLPTPGLRGVRRTESTCGVWITEGSVHVKRLRPLAVVRTRILARGVRAVLAEIDADLIVQLSPSQLLPLPAARFAQATGTPLVYISGEHSEQVPVNGLHRWASLLVRGTIVKGVQRHCVRRATLSLGATPETADGLSRHATDPSCVQSIRLPYDGRLFHHDPELRLATRRRRSWNGLVTLYSGKFDSRKNLPVLVDWWARLFKDEVDARLVLVGDSGSATPAEQELRDCVAATDPHRIQVLPFCPPDQLNGLMNAADVAVFPNASVGIHQAMGTGLSVIIPAVPALAGLVEGSYPEFVIPYAVDGTSSWTEASRALASDQELSSQVASHRKEIVDPGRRVARARRASTYSIQSLAQRILSVTVVGDTG